MFWLKLLAVKSSRANWSKYSVLSQIARISRTDVLITRCSPCFGVQPEADDNDSMWHTDDIWWPQTTSNNELSAAMLSSLHETWLQDKTLMSEQSGDHKYWTMCTATGRHVQESRRATTVNSIACGNEQHIMTSRRHEARSYT